MPSSSTSPRRLTALFHQGIKGLHHGHYLDAIFSFRHALECLSSATTAKLSEQQQLQDHDGVDRQDLDLPIVNVPLSLTNKNDIILQMTPHNVFDLYDSAFMFPTDGLVQLQPTAPCGDDGNNKKTNILALYQVELSAVLFYNLALAHHLAALREGACQDARQHLDHALHYYKLSLTILQSSDSKPTIMDDWCLLVMGLLTNMGFIFSHRCCPGPALSCANFLNDLLSSPAAARLEGDALDFFTAVLTHAKDFGMKAAPAA